MYPNLIALSLAISMLSSYLIIPAQELTDIQKEFIDEQLISIEVDSNYQHGNCEPVLSSIKNQQMISIGEFNHGSKEVFIARNELIKYLHEQVGVDLILFESGIGEVGIIYQNRNDVKGTELTSGFFGGWRTLEFKHLIRYAIDKNIPFGGFDVQRTGYTFTKYVSDTYKQVDSISEMEQRFVSLKSQLSNYRTEYNSVQTETQRLINWYQALIDLLPESDRLANQTLTNRVHYLTYMLKFTQTKDWNERWKARDSAMAQNIYWLLEEYKPVNKVIIVAHNFHISTYNEKETVMGEYLTEKFKDNMYVIGAFASKGSFHNNSGKVEYMSEPSTEDLDIKHIIDARNARLSFLNIPDTQTEVNEWLFKDIIINDTFIDLSSSNTLILSKCFDGLLLFEQVSPPSR